MCRYANKGVLVVDTPEKLKVLEKVLTRKPKEIKYQKPSSAEFRPDYWK